MHATGKAKMNDRLMQLQHDDNTKRSTRLILIKETTYHTSWLVPRLDSQKQ
jgi:hypothetical protein